MIDSLLRHPPGFVFNADLCIVGAGPAGLALAREFLDRDLRVLLVESGAAQPRPQDQILNHGVIAGAPSNAFELGRVRAFGGASWAWEGQCVALDEALRERHWIEGATWPLRAEALASYWRRAENFFGIPADGTRSAVGHRQPPFDGAQLSLERSRFARPVNVGRSQLDSFRRSSKVTTLLGANVTRLRLAGAGHRVEDAEVATLGGVRGRIRAARFVLCCGGIENARLLMLTGDLAQRLPALGRYFQDHMLARAAWIEPIDRQRLQDEFAADLRNRSWPRLALAAERQREAGVLGCHAYVGWDPPRGATALRALTGRSQTLRTRARSATEVAGDLPDLLNAAGRRVRGLSSAPRTGRMWLDVRCEQAPDPSSRVTLSADGDALGVPQPVLDWRFGELEWQTICAMVDAMGLEFERLSLARVQPAEWLTDRKGWRVHVTDALHHMGTTRMSSDPGRGVVDAACRVHGVSNLYVAGSSVFPSCGAANPTLGLVALAIRLADHLAAKPAVA